VPEIGISTNNIIAWGKSGQNNFGGYHSSFSGAVEIFFGQSANVRANFSRGLGPLEKNWPVRLCQVGYSCS